MERAITGRTVLLILVLGFGIVFAVNALFVTEALTTFRGGDEQNPYVQGIEYNQTLARHAEQAALAWRATIGIENKRTLVVTISSADGVPIASGKLAGELRHPSDANLDRVLGFRQVRPGRFAASLAGAGTGAWDVVVHSTEAKQPFEASRRIWLR